MGEQRGLLTLGGILVLLPRLVSLLQAAVTYKSTGTNGAKTRGETRGQRLEGFLAQYKKPAGGITLCGSDDSPCWPDGVVVQHTDLMHSTATVQTFHKPRGEREREREKPRDKLRKDGNGKQRLCGGGCLEANVVASVSLFILVETVCICGHVAPRWDLLFRVQCVVLFLLKLIFVNRSAENDWERVLENKRL